MRQMVRYESASAGPSAATRDTAHGVARDISEGGLSLRTPTPLRRGEILRLHVPLPGGPTSVPIRSEVLWTKEEEGGFSSGLQFLA
jgi:PilZ domain